MKVDTFNIVDFNLTNIFLVFFGKDDVRDAGALRSQDFFFYQLNFVFGATINLKKHRA